MLLQIRHDEIKGRGLFAARPISAGEVVLQELPFMLYPQQSAADSVCSHCLRALHTPGTDVMVCSSCSSAAFCSPECAEAVATDAGSHCAQVCQWLTACNMQGLTDDQQSALQFLFRCVSLLQAAAAGDARSTQRRGQLQQLAPGPARVPVAVTTELQELHGRLAHALAAAGTPQLAAGLSVQEVAEMLERDETNGYGILAPAQGPHGERRIRGTGLYAQASLINHDCLPNLARFDSFDAPVSVPGANTAVQIRALHDIPAGEEVTLSYFPLPWTFPERQERCQQEYGFTCTCGRCKEEAAWPSEEGGVGDAAMADAGGSGAGSEQQQGEADGEPDAGYISMFMMKFVCPEEDCLGTMAPLQLGSDVAECNVCGHMRTEAEFLAELEADNASE